MPRKFFKKISPPPHKLAQKSALGWLNGLLHKPDIWSYKRINIAKAFAIGVFCSMLPIPFQMVLAAYVAYLCAANLPISVALVWISNPLTMPALYLFQYKLGSWVMGEEVRNPLFELSISWFYGRLEEIWQPFLLGAFICAIVGSILGYVVVNRLWVWKVRKTWRIRRIDEEN
ncbi:MAG: ATP-binding protein [Oceanospirillaceae bacterium]|nr:ATP-binding protein [Oceanospirillaceae bacterium]HCI03024.1 DUF2062 domain-containing protein [Oceanospirillaceae bacterium]